ncbi:hypothetical protein FB567DRAFT_249600 [Paraphoma chrysanthemicola]|uniref:C2H2-type domain-containing protein n=1 Tax=Paraphoma chrysanthemicola TaxID=798071 RepID=A0A8K0VS92_9PLEO|nr:hypothetical protein FB567DRAFT_249600 [Paraphoma chrysanthemicola]
MPLPYTDQGSLGYNDSLPRAAPSGPASPSPRPSDNNSHRLPCPICVNKAPFTGVYAHRNLNRHMESMHAPCASADGVKHIRCSFQECDKTFRREDARLVHERRSHPELNRPPPSKRKRSGEL